MEQKVAPYVTRHKTDPEWILSRYIMNRAPGKRYTDFYSDEDGTELVRYSGDAPYPTVRCFVAQKGRLLQAMAMPTKHPPSQTSFHTIHQ